MRNPGDVLPTYLDVSVQPQQFATQRRPAQDADEREFDYEPLALRNTQQKLYDCISPLEDGDDDMPAQRVIPPPPPPPRRASTHAPRATSLPAAPLPLEKLQPGIFMNLPDGWSWLVHLISCSLSLSTCAVALAPTHVHQVGSPCHPPFRIL
jgi:hypothetical protein